MAHDHDLSYFKGLKNRTPFFVFDKEVVLNNLKTYRKHFPANTEICYAMKANSEKPVLETLNDAGASFEVASKYELALLKKIKIPAKRIVYGTSVKPIGHIKTFVKYGVDRFAFDSEEELKKIARYAPGSRVYVRTLVDDRSDSIFTMSEKFGCALEDVPMLLLKAKEMGLIPYGISFNVGSQARNEHAWARGIQDINKIMKELVDKDLKIQVINLGGGFPFTYDQKDSMPMLEEISRHVNEAIKQLPYEVGYIAEPGRALVADAFTLVTQIIAKNERPNGNWLYVDAGVYNALLEAMTCQGSTSYEVEALPSKKGHSDKKQHFILTGPTGDNLDVINKKVSLPVDLKIGDKLVIHDVGAYTFTLMTHFNGFPKPKTIS